MGRVAKYKKVKSFDPYSKKNGGKVDLPNVGVWGLGDNGRKVKKRSKKAERMHARKDKNKSLKKGTSKKSNKFVDDGGFDVPPMEEDEFNMKDLMGSVKRQKVETSDLLGSSIVVASSAEATNDNNNKNSNDDTTTESYNKIVTSTGNVANIPKTEQDENKVARLLRLDKQEERKAEKDKLLSHARMEGESKRAYAKRTRAETRQIIQKTTTTKNHEKLLLKKEFLKNKKKNKKRKGGGTYSANENRGGGNDDDYDSDKGSSAEAPVRFGEQALRPPVFRQIPRGATSKSKTVATTKSVATQGMSEDQVEAERDAMDLLRRRVQAQYKAIKTKRKNAGDFHL